MKLKTKVSFLRYLLAFFSVVMLLTLSWWAIAGGLRQLSHAITFGQQAETIVQLSFGVLSVLTLMTCFIWRTWARLVRQIWTVTMVVTAGLSALVWGPPMPVIGLAFSGVALLLAVLLRWAMRKAFAT
jgi:hypothetical protein